jgi:integrase
MTPERVSKGGQFRSSWERKEIGRIRVTYGRTLKDHHRALAILDELYKNDQHDVLRALKAKRVTIRDVLAAKKAGRLGRDDLLVDLRLQQPLWSTLERLIATRTGISETQRTNLGWFLKKFASTSAAAKLGQRAVFKDLLTVDWAALESEYSSPAYWNHNRKLISLCTAQLLDDVHHPFRRALMKKIDKRTEPEVEVDIEVEQFWELVDALPEHARPGVVTLAVTGMRVNTEYMAANESHLRPRIHAVYAPGSKNADAKGHIYVAESLWKWVEAGIPAPVKTNWLRKYLHRAAAEVGLGRFIPVPGSEDAEGQPTKHTYEGLTLGQLRHLALQLALDGGATLNDVQAMARHADPKMTMRYLRRNRRKSAAAAVERALTRKPKASGDTA